MSIHIIKQSILDFKGDCIVNPANSFLDHRGGLARIIAEAARAPFDPQPISQWDTPTNEVLAGAPGPAAKVRAAMLTHNTHVNQWIFDHKRAPLIATGNSHMTSAGVLPFKAVIHAVGPIWNGGAYGEEELLRMAYCSAILLAEEAGFTSIAFPAISCGVFGYPVAEAAFSAVATALLSPLDVTFCLMEDSHISAFEHARAHLMEALNAAR